MRNKFNLSLLVLLLAVIALSCSKSPDSSNSTETECGVERWHVKTLLDSGTASISWTPVVSSIAEQNGFTKITVAENAARLDFEKKIVSIQCTISAYKKEDDSDIHLILTDGLNDSMIAEIPSVNCQEVAATPYAVQFQAASQWVTNNLGKPSTIFKSAKANVTVTGVLFQDFDHGQVGHANNYREIHPVLKIE